MTLFFIIGSAVIYSLSFPKFDLSPGIFFFLIPILFVIDQKKNKKIFLTFFLFSFFSNIVILYWIPEVMIKYGGTNLLLGVAALIALSSFLAVFTGIAGILIKKIFNKKSVFLLIPAIWISKDLILEYVFNGFPWCYAGYSQYKNLYFVQSAEFGGIHLISFIIILINVLLFFYIKERERKYLISVLIIFVLVYSSGYYLVKSNVKKIEKLKSVKAGIIQPNAKNDLYSERIAHNFKKSNREILNELFNASEELAKKGAEFVVWPEYTIPIYPLQSKVYLDKFLQFAKEHVPLLTGFTDYENKDTIYNSSILFKKNAFEKYDKVHLVPFGEYILLKDFLFFIKKITDQIGEFTPGKNIRNLHLQNHLISTPICYEIIFPTLVRNFISKGGELLVTLSNDSWYGTTSAPYQLLAMATFRSIENRRYNLRATSSGISALISPLGKVIKKLTLNRKGSFIAEFKYIKEKTIFTKFGYIFPFLNIIFVFLWFIFPILKKRLTFLFF